MFLTHFGKEHISQSSIWILYQESDGLGIKITNEDYINMTLKSKIATLKNLIEMWQMNLNDPKFDIRKSLDTLVLLSSVNNKIA